MADYLIKGETLTDIADEVRELSGTNSSMTTSAMIANLNEANNEVESQTALIEQITTALEGKAGGSEGVVLPTLSTPASSSDILSGKQAIDGNGNIMTGTIATKTSSNLTVSGATVSVPAGYYASNTSKSVATSTQASPSISINSNGLITATTTQTAGYVTAGSKSGTKQLTTKAAATYTPTTSDQTIASGTYLTGTQTIKGDTNLIADNIKSGTSIFGITGTYEGTGSSGSSSLVVSVQVNNDSSQPVYYWDANGDLCFINSLTSQVVNALNGVLYYKQEMETHISPVGKYRKAVVSGGVCVAIILSDGCIMTCYPHET